MMKMMMMTMMMIKEINLTPHLMIFHPSASQPKQKQRLIMRNHMKWWWDVVFWFYICNMLVCLPLQYFYFVSVQLTVYKLHVNLQVASVNGWKAFLLWNKICITFYLLDFYFHFPVLFCKIFSNTFYCVICLLILEMCIRDLKCFCWNDLKCFLAVQIPYLPDHLHKTV